MRLTFVRAHPGKKLLVCFVLALVYNCLFIDWLQILKYVRNTDILFLKRKEFFKPEKLEQNLEKSTRYNLTLANSFDKKQLNRQRQRMKDNDSSKTSFPHINPDFHVNMAEDKSVHTILFWNVPDWFKKWISTTDMNQCIRFKNCRQSLDRSEFNESSAVVFNLPHSGMGYKPPVSPQLRNPNQAWVFFTLESPLHLSQDYKSPHWKHVFNWSWTYHPNADIFHPYGVLIEKQKIPFKNYTAIFRNKTKSVAWAVSNCMAPSKRGEYVNILKRYVDVDVFGRCGQNTPGLRTDNLLNIINNNYKFYLGFENSLCENYMTEKFFRYYKLDVITVLRGKTEYHKYIPNGSYIDTTNFTNIASLAAFLKEVGADEKKFTSYLKIKDRYKVIMWDVWYKDAVCNLCEKVNTLDKNMRIYEDVRNWLGACYEATDLKGENSTFDLLANATGL